MSTQSKALLLHASRGGEHALYIYIYIYIYIHALVSFSGDVFIIYNDIYIYIMYARSCTPRRVARIAHC